MQCMSCDANIPPQWVNAIESNTCPGCGQAIMDDSSKELLDELKDAMEKMPNDPAGLAGWLLSNYNLYKIGDAQPTEFHRQRQQQRRHDPSMPNNLKIADNPKSVFLQRAGMARELSRRDKMENIVNQINSAGEHDVVEVDLDQIDDYEGLDEYEAMALAQSQNVPQSARHLANNSLLISGQGAGGPPPSAEEAAMLAQMLGGQQQAIDGTLPPALQVDRMKRLRAQQEVAAGGKAGKIRRSG